MPGPDPLDPSPLPGHPRVGFLRAFVDRPNVEVGDFTYYDDPEGPQRFLEACVLHHFDFVGDRLIIGRFCAIATGVQFIMNGANHDMTGFSTYPFEIFGKGWEADYDPSRQRSGFKGDTIVGNDVWIGHEATLLPGTRIGDGAIVAAKAVVGGQVPPYAIVAGNPARTVRPRFDEATIAALLDLRWWDWSIDKITRNLAAIRGSHLDALRRAR